jgi:hypothetical protein
MPVNLCLLTVNSYHVFRGRETNVAVLTTIFDTTIIVCTCYKGSTGMSQHKSGLSPIGDSLRVGRPKPP